MIFLLKGFKLRYLQFALILSFQLSPANGKDGVNGPNAQLRVGREPKSGLELAAKVMGRVQENQQRPKIVSLLSVQVSIVQHYLLSFYIIPGPRKATPTPTVPPTVPPTTTPPTATPTPSYILRKISFLDLQICYSLFMSPIPQLMASRDVVLLIMVNC